MDRRSNGYPIPAPPKGLNPRGPHDVSRPEPLRPTTNATKAEMFEDEKKRIVESCFSKRDEAGKVVQSYITHIRVEEDAAYQSSPPPPGSNPQYKKPRVIILAVKANGRVSMHKARENEDGTFQIGKTWGLEELVSIESFSNSLPKTPQQQERANWAGPVGFIINMAKPYYWQAKTAKEKEFFITSLVKIYNRFTGGRLPELIGFDPKEHDSLVASTQPAGAASQAKQPPAAAPLANPADSRLALPPSLAAPSGFRPGTSQSSNSATSSQYMSQQQAERPSLGSDWRPASNSSNQGSMLSPELKAASPYRQPNAALGGPRPAQQARSPPPPAPAFPIASSSRNVTPQYDSRSTLESGAWQAAPVPHPSTRLQSPTPPSNPHLTPQASSRSMVSESSTNSTAPANSVSSLSRTSDRNLNGSYNPTPQTVASKGDSKGTFAASTSDRWKPASSDDAHSTTESWRTPPESAASTSLRSRQGGAIDVQSNGDAQILPERRRPPLQESAYSSNGPSRVNSTTRSPISAVASTLKGPFTDAPAFTPETPESQKAYELPDNRLEQSSTRENTKDSAAVSPLKPRVERGSDGFGGEARMSSEQEPDKEVQYRPGLGPMMGKKLDVANKMRKAVNAHKAFVPRAGGAGDRLLSKANKANEPDGVTGVVLPTRPPPQTDDQTAVPKALAETETQPEELKTLAKRLSPPPLVVPDTRDLTSAVEEKHIPQAEQREETMPQLERQISPASMPRPLVVQKSTKATESGVPKRKPNPFSGALAGLGLESTFGLDKRIADYEDQLNEFGWERDFLQKKQFDGLQAKMRREVGRIEAGGWLGQTEHGDHRIELFEKSIDKAISAVDEVDGLLTLYAVELSTLVDDVAYIEAQSHGLQVQTANQKLLHAELEQLIETVSLDTRQLDALRMASLGDFGGIEAIEHSLGLLYRALEKIDPASLNRGNDLMHGNNTSGHGMRALQERKQIYLQATDDFLRRFKEFVDPAFGAAFKKTQDALQRFSVSSRGGGNPHDLARAELWRFSPIMLFTKQVNPLVWDDIIRIYQARAGNVYGPEIKESIAEWKKRAQKQSSEDQYSLFTTQEKESESLTSAARKMTVKRSATLARSFRTPTHKDRSSLVRSHDSECAPYEAFANILHENIPTICAEQNFLVDFFHVSPLDGGDFLEAISVERPNERRGRDAFARRAEAGSDRGVSAKVVNMMKTIFATWSYELLGLVDWAGKQNEFQLIGILGILERAHLELDDSSQEYLIKNFQPIHDAAITPIPAFIEAQLKAIDNVKVKTNKRRGLMSFTRRLPNFANAIENVLPAPESASSRNPHSPRSSDVLPSAQSQPTETRKLVDEAYDRIISAIFKNLEIIAKGSGPSLAAVAAGADSEDKEKLNHEILLIENMHHIATNLDPAGSATLHAWRGRAEQSMLEHRARYVDAVIRRPLGRILDFLEALGPEGGVRARRDQATYGRSAFKKALGGYDAKACRRDVEALRKRVEKHFMPQEGQGSADEGVPTGHNRIVVEILEVCKARFDEVVRRVEALAGEYDPPVEVEISRQDVGTAFRR